MIGILIQVGEEAVDLFLGVIEMGGEAQKAVAQGYGNPPLGKI